MWNKHGHLLVMWCTYFSRWRVCLYYIGCYKKSKIESLKEQLQFMKIGKSECRLPYIAFIWCGNEGSYQRLYESKLSDLKEEQLEEQRKEMEEEHQKKLEEERQHSYEERAPCRKNWKNRNLRWTRWKRNMQQKK